MVCAGAGGGIGGDGLVFERGFELTRVGGDVEITDAAAVPAGLTVPVFVGAATPAGTGAVVVAAGGLGEDLRRKE